jgi:hypothetical protein
MNAIGQGVAGLSQPIAQATGMPQASVENMIGSGTVALAPVVPKATAAIGRGADATVQGAKNMAGAARDVGQGMYGGFTGTTKAPGQPVKPWETASARQPIGDTYIPANVLEQYRAGQITAEQAQAAAQSTANLPQSALRRTEGMVPYAGQEWRALGEQIGAGYRDPYKLALEAGTDLLTGGGLPSAARLGMKGYDLFQGQKAFRQLGQAGFTPLTAAEQATFSGSGPRTPPPPGGGSPVSGPVSPTPVAQTPAPNVQSTMNRRAPPGVSNMIVPDQTTTPTVYATKEAFDKATLLDRVAGRPLVGSYKEGKYSRTHLEDGSVITTNPVNKSGSIIASEKVMPNPNGDSYLRTVRNQEVGVYNETQRGPDVIQREVKLPNMTITQENGFIYRKGQQVPTQSIEVRTGNRIDRFENGKYVSSTDLTGQPLKAPGNKKQPDIDGLIKKIKGE